MYTRIGNGGPEPGAATRLLSADDYDTLQGTIAVLSDAELLAAHHEGCAAVDAGEYVDADQLSHATRVRPDVFLRR